MLFIKHRRMPANRFRATESKGAQPQPSTDPYMENHMKTRKQPVVRKPGKKIADSHRIRFGTGCAPAKLARTPVALITDSGAIRFGTGCAPAIFRK